MIQNYAPHDCEGSNGRRRLAIPTMGVLLLVLLCARLWVCLMRLMVRYERDKQTDDDHPGGAG